MPTKEKKSKRGEGRRSGGNLFWKEQPHKKWTKARIRSPLADWLFAPSLPIPLLHLLPASRLRSLPANKPAAVFAAEKLLCARTKGTTTKREANGNGDTSQRWWRGKLKRTTVKKGLMG
jgi:hypothetical protein